MSETSAKHDTEPYVIVCSGQSNMARSHANTPWIAPENLKVWNYDRVFGNERPATEFVKPETSRANYADQYGAAVARHYPERPVYVINISKGEQSLKQWHPGVENDSMLRAIFNNVSAALGHIANKTYIDELLWWGHESDGAETGGVPVGQFKQAMQQVIGKLDLQPWANRGRYAIHFHRIHPQSHVLADTINFSLHCLSLDDPDRISLHDTTGFKYSDNIHLDGDQKESVATKVFAGECLVANAEHSHINTNLLPNNIGKLRIKKRTALEPGTPLVIELDSANLAGKVITFSVFKPNAPVLVKMSGKEAMLLPSKTREFVSFLVPTAYDESIRLVIMPASKLPVSMRDMKLEIGSGFTPISIHGEEQERSTQAA